MSFCHSNARVSDNLMDKLIGPDKQMQAITNRTTALLKQKAQAALIENENQ